MATRNATARPAALGHLATKKSCDLCVSRKRKCDGTSQCSFCASRGRECHYSLRRPNRPKGYAKRLVSEGHGHGGEEGSSLSAKQMHLRMQHRHQDTPTVGWKRVRLSASPATGLVGMEENVFLGWFFDCLGFLPLSDESQVRGAIMHVFLGVPPESKKNETVAKAERSDAAKTAKKEPGMEVEMEVEVGMGSTPGGGQQREREQEEEQEQQRGFDAACTCTLWCAVAMGALVKGQPPERVAPYMRFAWVSLSQCFDTVTAETARAFTMMAFLFNFLRNDHKFYRYLRFARGVVNRLPDNTTQKQEIVELLARANDTRIFHTAATEPGELDAYCEADTSALEVPDVINKGALCKFLLEADRRLIKAFLRDHKAQVTAPTPAGLRDDREATSSSSSPSSSGELEPSTAAPLGMACRGRRHRDEAESVGGKDVQGGGDGDDDDCGQISDEMGGGSMGRNTMDDEADPSDFSNETHKCTDEATEVFTRLHETSKIPEIGAGVGGVIYNAIFGYLDLVTGGPKLKIGRAKIKRSAEVFARYPGLCRFSTWLHLAHCLLSILAKLEDTGPYERLRKAYNSIHGKERSEAPPHGEWTMVGFCDHIFCRSIDKLGKRDDSKTTNKDDGETGTTASDTGETDKDPCHWFPGACEEYVRSCPQPATADPDEMLVLQLQKTEMSGIPALQPVDLAPEAPRLSGVGAIETCQSVLSIAGLLGVTEMAGDRSTSGSTSPSTFGDTHADCGPSLSVSGSSAFGCYNTPGAPTPSSFGRASQQHFMSDGDARAGCLEGEMDLLGTGGPDGRRCESSWAGRCRR